MESEHTQQLTGSLGAASVAELVCMTNVSEGASFLSSFFTSFIFPFLSCSFLTCSYYGAQDRDVKMGLGGVETYWQYFSETYERELSRAMFSC